MDTGSEFPKLVREVERKSARLRSLVMRDAPLEEIDRLGSEVDRLLAEVRTASLLSVQDRQAALRHAICELRQVTEHSSDAGFYLDLIERASLGPDEEVSAI